MRLVKFCKKEHNIKTGSPTIQLGTFQYYRELDPTFSIADVSEGTITYKAEPTAENPLLLTPEQWNAVSGGVVRITRQNQHDITRWPGSVDFVNSGGVTEFTNDGHIKYHGNLNIKYSYPNAYMFCMTLVEDDEPIPDPSEIDPSYDSYYEVKAELAEQFMKILGHLLHSSLTYQDILFDRLNEPALLSIPSQETHVAWIHNKVSYVESRITNLTSAKDFELKSLQLIYQRSLFEKALQYESNREYRFVFFAQHPRLGVLTARKEPKVLTINQLGTTIV